MSRFAGSTDSLGMSIRWKDVEDMIAQDLWFGRLLPLGEHMPEHTVWRELLWGHLCSVVDRHENILVQYVRCDNVPPRAGVIVVWEDVEALAQNAKYQGGIAHLEIKREFGFGTSTVRLIIRKVSMHLMIIRLPRVLELCRHLNITEVETSN